jgi:uncharacterized membrane protein
MDDITPPPKSAPPTGAATLPSGRGSAWWSEGWRLFAAAPGVWIAITLIFVVLTVMMSLIPMIGSLASTLLAPVFAGGVLLGCRAIDRGGALAVTHLFAGFADRLGPLVIVGVLYLVGTVLIMVLVVGGLVASIGVGGFQSFLAGDPFGAAYAMVAALGVGALLTALLGLLLGIPLIMACWFAPALVVFRNDEPLAAMKASFNASLVNMLPMFVYSLLGLAFAIAASIPFFLGWLVLAPVFAGSIYASYKDIFGTPE